MAVRSKTPRAWPAGGFSSIFPILAAVLALGLSLLAASPAAANSRYASLVLNADTGDVIYSRNADARRYPASLTKVMTLYMLFEALEDGSLTMESELAVSRRAAGQPPSKLGVIAGTTITVHEAIQALTVRSANDVAVVVAEALGDTEWSFSRLMNRRAREMGMSHTSFQNASGLPHRSQHTTARDLAVMAMHMVNDFPQHMHYFSQRSFTYNDHTWQTHNHLLENYEGTTGMKTGYIRASGFNLITTVERGDISLVGIVLGGRTAGRRDTEMARLLDLNFERLTENPYFGSRVFTSDVRPVYRPDPDSRTPTATVMASIELNAIPALRPSSRPASYIPAELASIGSPELAPSLNTLLAEADVLASPMVEPVRTMPEDTIETLLASNVPNNNTELDYSLELSPSAGVMDLSRANEMILASNDNPQTADDAMSFRAVQGSGGPQNWGIHVGQFDMPEQADTQLRQAAVMVPTMLTWGMAALIPDTDERDLQFAAGFGPMTEDEAMDACASLVGAGVNCQTTDDVDWDMALRR